MFNIQLIKQSNNMAKQTLKIIAEREAQLLEMKFVKSDMQYTGVGGTMHIDNLYSISKTAWDSFIKTAQELIQKNEAIAIVEKSGAVVLTSPDTSLFEQKKAEIQAFAEQYKGLKIYDLQDKEGYKQVAEAKKVVRKTRTTIEAKRKDIKAFYLEEGRKIDDKAKELTAIISPIEEHLDSELQEFERWELAEQTRIEEERRAELERRIDILKKSGITFNGTWYTIGESIFVDIATIQILSEVDFLELNDKVAAEQKKIEEAAEAQRLESERQAEIEKEAKAEFERQQAKLKADQERMEAAEVANRKKRDGLRHRLLMSIGMDFSDGKNYVFVNKFYSCQHPATDILECSEEQFDTVFEHTEADIKEAIEKADKLKAQIASRESEVLALGFKIANTEWVSEFNTVSAELVLEKLSDEEFQTFIKDSKFNIEEKKAEKAKQAAQDARFESNCQRLYNLGFVRSAICFIYLRIPAEQCATVNENDLRNVTPENENSFFEKVSADKKIVDDQAAAAIELKKEQEAEAERRRVEAEQIYNNRIAEVVNFGLKFENGIFVRYNEFGENVSVADNFRTMEHEKYPAFLNDIQRIVEDFNRKTDAKRERIAAEKEALKPDLEKAYEYLQLLDAKMPEIKSKQIKDICLSLKKEISDDILWHKYKLDALK